MEKLGRNDFEKYIKNAVRHIFIEIPGDSEFKLEVTRQVILRLILYTEVVSFYMIGTDLVITKID